MFDERLRGAIRHARFCLLASTALVALPGMARGQDMSVVGRPTGADDQPQIIVSPPTTPTTARDLVDVNGVGQMTIALEGGGLGLCTGTLINPRTVIFAAHCVNENAAGDAAQDPWQYGSKGGGIPIAFGFRANNLQAVRDWYFGAATTGAGQFQTNQANYLYNVNQVVYNADSLKLGLGLNFLQGDVALATLDTPANNVPTWTVLLSALPAPASISETTGTGYHVTLTGYGNTGTGLTGEVQGSIDYRRKVAENFIGLLGSFDDRDAFLFGDAGGLPQNLYNIDFDDPRRGTGTESPYDFNLFKDDALPGEGTTGGGDSGGPLILDRTFDKKTVIGVLSGGSRFFGPQRFGSYGTQSFYQPLYLFWDYLVANNPYRYATTVAGDGNWTDPNHWVTALDPAYQIIVGGKLVNGVPTAPGAGIAGDASKFGQICFFTDCYDVATGIETVDGEPVTATGTAPAATAKAKLGAKGAGMMAEDAAQGGRASAASLGAQDVAQAGGAPSAAAVAALPPATLANGLPGATGFSPNNIDPDRAIKRSARYYDVTLGATGTTTLGSAVTIDRFTIAGAGARLNVTSAGSLTSLMEINHLAGTAQVDGALSSRGDYFLLSGLLTGSGRINAPFFTSIGGFIAPGTAGTVGTLTIGGSAILSSANTLLIDLGPNGTSDRLAVVATTFGANGTTPTNGIANIGGRVAFAPTAGTTVRYNDLYTIVTAQGGLTGTFSNAVAPLSAILTPTYVYTANAAQVRIAAGLYANVVANTPIQAAYAGLLDRNRATNYAGLSDVYGILDLQNAGTIQTTLEGLAPRSEQLVRSLGTVATDNMARFYRDHLAQMDVRGGLGGTLAVIGKPVQVAALAASDLPGGGQMASDSSGTVLEQGRLPEDMSGFIAGGYLDGDSRPLPNAIPTGGRDQFNGYYAAAGLEKEAGPNGAIGFAFSYTRVKGHTDVADQRARGELYQGTLYGKLESDSGIVLDAQASGGAFDVRTNRTAALPGATYSLRSRDRALAVNAEVGLGKGFEIGSIKVGPRIAARASRLGFTPTVETGGGPALRYDRGNYDSVQGRAGLTLAGGMRLRPYASAYYVHEFQDKPGAFGANFAGGVGPSAVFALAGDDKNWAEVAAGLAFGSDKVELSVGADTTIARKDVKNQAYRGAIKFRF